VSTQLSNIVFHQLERNDLVKIVDLEVAKVIERVRVKDIKVRLDTTAVEFLIDKGYDPIYGARPMRRAVEKYLEDLKRILGGAFFNSPRARIQTFLQGSFLSEQFFAEVQQ
jgi:ATP-dependent Clp protease ATP-binding subunit ClpC